MFVFTKTVFSTLRRLSIQLAVTVGVVVLLAQTSFAGNAPSSNDEPTDSQATVSTFTLPETPQQGHDPFFPTSDRVWNEYHPKPTPTPGPATLVLKGISGPPDRRLAIINNQTLAVGEEQDVTTSQGKVKVMCLAIEGLKVKIRAQGQTRELMLRAGI